MLLQPLSIILAMILVGVGVGIYADSTWLGVATACAAYALSPHTM